MHLQLMNYSSINPKRKSHPTAVGLASGHTPDNTENRGAGLDEGPSAPLAQQPGDLSSFLLLLTPELTPGQGLSLRITSVFSISVRARSTEVFNSTGLLCVPPETASHICVPGCKEPHKTEAGGFLYWRSRAPKARDFLELAKVVTRLGSLQIKFIQRGLQIT